MTHDILWRDAVGTCALNIPDGTPVKAAFIKGVALFVHETYESLKRADPAKRMFCCVARGLMPVSAPTVEGAMDAAVDLLELEGPPSVKPLPREAFLKLVNDVRTVFYGHVPNTTAGVLVYEFNGDRARYRVLHALGLPPTHTRIHVSRHSTAGVIYAPAGPRL